MAGKRGPQIWKVISSGGIKKHRTHQRAGELKNHGTFIAKTNQKTKGDSRKKEN